MYEISEAKKLKNDIQNNSHYPKCLNGSKWDNYISKRNELDNISSTYDNILEEKQNLISCKNTLNNKELEYKRYRENKSREYDNMKSKYHNEIEVKESQNRNILNFLERDIKYEIERENSEINIINR